MNTKNALVTLIAVASLALGAETYYWIGPESGEELSTPSNWAKADGTIATTLDGDTLVFTNEAPLSIRNASTWSTKAIYPVNFRVERGSVHFARTAAGGRAYTYLKGSPTFYVAAGCLLSCTNDFAAYFSGQTCEKTGAGVFELCGDLDERGSFTTTTVKEGTFRIVGLSDDKQPYFNSHLVVVKEGARLEVKGGAKFPNTKKSVPVTVETGGTLALLGAENGVVLSGLTGGGAVTATGSSASYLLMQGGFTNFTGTLSGSMYLGTVSGSSQVFTLSDPDFTKDILGLCLPDGIVFGAGIGSFAFPYVSGKLGGTLRLEDADGQPIAMRTGLVDASDLTIAGGGDLTVTNDVELLGPKYTATGVLGVDGKCTLRLGNNLSSGDFDYSGTSPREIRIGDDSTLYFKSSADSFDVRLPVIGNGAIRIYRYGTRTIARFHDLRNREGTQGPISAFGGQSSGMWDLMGGSATLPSSLIGSGGTKTVDTVSGGAWHGICNVSSADSLKTLKLPSTVSVSGNSGWNSVQVTGGQFWSALGNGCKDIFLRGGTAWIESNSSLCTSDGTQKDGGRSQFVFDGGLAIVPRRKGTETIAFLNDNNKTKTALYVTDKGGRLVALDEEPGSARTFWCGIPFEVCTNTVTTGLLTIEFGGSIQFGVPMQLNGPVKVRDGSLLVSSAALDATGSAFGSGELTLENATYKPSETNSVMDVTVPGGLAFAGGALVNLSSTKQHRMTVGSLRRADAGSILVVYTDQTALPFGEEDGPAFRVTGGLVNDSQTGSVSLPVFVATGDAQRYVEFARYDATKGLVPFDNYLTSFTGADATRYVKLGAATSVGDGKTVAVAGLCFSQNSHFTVTLGKNARLSVGNGTDPAAILLQVCSDLNGATGTVDFGGSEGLFVVPTSHQGEPNRISPVLAGSNGIAYFCLNSGHDQKIAILNANTYTGGTRIWGVDLYARHAGAFSSGTVIVGGGRARGGRVLLDCEGATFANAFRLAGYGNRHTTDSSAQKGRLYLNYRKGALSFAKNATVSGAVELCEPTRVTAADDVTGVISGVVSGDHLEIYKPFPNDAAGVVKLAAANTYTGGTEVVSSTLALGTGTSAGTGEVVLDNAILRFDNAGTVTFANKVRGVGTVRLAGAGVNFTGDLSGLSAPLYLDARRCEFTVTPPFDTIATERTLAEIVLKAPGNYDLTGKTFSGRIRLTLEAGATIDLNGGSLDVFQFNGDEKAVNGTIRAQEPYCPGTLFIIR